MNNHKYYRKY